MPKRNFSTLAELKANLHEYGTTIVPLNGGGIPCLLVNQEEYDRIMHIAYGRHLRVETVLDIFHNGEDVFVDIFIKFSDIDFERNYLLYANNMLEFFELLVESGLMAISSELAYSSGSQDVFVIQIPKKDAAEHALEIIKKNIKKLS
jgi:hypothetical protein